MDQTPRITLDDKVLAGKPVVRGTRLSVDFIIGLLAEGWTRADVIRQYLGLTEDDLSACLAHARDALRAERVYGCQFT